METSTIQGIEAIKNAIAALDETYEEYKPVAAAYRDAMNATAGYEVVPGLDDSLTRRASLTLEMLSSGELTNKGRDRAIEAGLIRKIVATKPQKLVDLEARVISQHNDVVAFVKNTLAKYQVEQHKARGTRSSSGDVGEIGAGKKADVTAIIRGIDSGAVVNFNGRRVFGTLSNGVTFDYDAYGQSYPNALRKMVNGA